jgi:hypothetical protein
MYRLNYEKLVPPKEAIPFLVEYFNEYDTGDNGIIAHMDDAAIEDMADMVFQSFTEQEQAAILKELKDWWEFEFSMRERNEGIDIQILTQVE